MFALLAAPAGEVTYAGVAESPDGKADMLEMKDARGQALRLFVDQQTHLPLMLAYQEVRPRMMMQGGPGGRRGGGPGGPGGRGPGQGAGGRHRWRRAAGTGTGAGAPAPPLVPRQVPARANVNVRAPKRSPARIAAMPPPTPSAVQMTFADYTTVDGVKLPKRISVSRRRHAVEEWTLEKIKVNPSLKADFFDKK